VLRVLTNNPLNTKIYDYGGNPTLFRHIRRVGAFPERITRNIIAQTLLALKEIHKKGFLSWNLSPECIFLDGDGNVLIGDLQLGLAIEHRRDIPLNEYTSPEDVKGETYTTASDFWKLGILAFELLLGVPPTWTPSHGPQDIESKIKGIEQDGLKDFPSNILSDSAKELIGVLLGSSEKRKELNYNNISKLPFFKNVDFKTMQIRGHQSPNDEWWEHNICSFCPSLYEVYPDDQDVDCVEIIPDVNQKSSIEFFVGLPHSDDEENDNSPSNKPNVRNSGWDPRERKFRSLKRFVRYDSEPMYH